MRRNTVEIENTLTEVSSNSISVFDTKARRRKSSYHNLLVGILTGNDDWLVSQMQKQEKALTL